MTVAEATVKVRNKLHKGYICFVCHPVRNQRQSRIPACHGDGVCRTRLPIAISLILQIGCRVIEKGCKQIGISGSFRPGKDCNGNLRERAHDPGRETASRP